MTNSQEYVLCMVYDFNTDKAAFVLKDRPNWQAGRVNLPGGKVDPGETPKQAVIREIKEELGIDLGKVKKHEPRLMGKITGAWGTIWCFKADISKSEIVPRVGETEIFFWDEIDVVRTDGRCLPNLKLIVPLMQQEVTKWTITDNNPDIDVRPYTIEIALEDN